MATTEMSTCHEPKQILEKNSYLSDGHGIEPLIRTNRHLQDANYLMPETRGYNVPEDPHIAALTMEIAQKEYEYNIGHKDEIERKNGARSVYLYQLFASFHNLEWVSPQQRHEMVARLVEEMIRRGCPIRVVDHNNTWCRHIHIIICAYDPDGHHKVRISLADLRRAMDRICADYGLSIIDAPYLHRDGEYAKWFSAIVESGEIVVHPKRVRTTEHETREDSPAGKQWAKRKHPKWDPQTAGCYYYLPPWVPPWEAADESMYCPAMDMENPLWGWGLSVRHAPLYLLLTAAQERAQACEEELLHQKNKNNHKRIERVQKLVGFCAGGLELMCKVDVGTMADIDRHIACAQADIWRRLGRQRELIKELVRARFVEHVDQKKLERIGRRQENNDQWILELRQECRRLEQLKRLCRMLQDPDMWAEYGDIIMSNNLPRNRTAKTRIPRKPYIRAELRNISQLIGASSDAAEEEMWSVVQRGQPAVIKRCATVIPEVTMGIAQAMAEVAQLCTTITDPYAEHDRINAVREKLQQQMDGGTLLRGMMALDTALLRYVDGAERDQIAARVRSAVEEICWHVQNALLQLTTAQSLSTLRTAYGELALAMAEWQRFLKVEMPRLNRRTKVEIDAMLILPPCPDYTLPLEEQVSFDFRAALEKYKAQMERARDKLDRGIVRKYGSDPALEREKKRTEIPPQGHTPPQGSDPPEDPNPSQGPTPSQGSDPPEDPNPSQGSDLPQGSKHPEGTPPKDSNPPEVKPDVSEKEQRAEPLRPPLAGMVANAQDRSGQAKSTHQGKQASKNIEPQRQ